MTDPLMAEWNAIPMIELAPPPMRERIEADIARRLADDPGIKPEGVEWMIAAHIAGAMLAEVGFELEQTERILFAHVARPETTPHNFIFNVYTLFKQGRDDPPFEGFERDDICAIFEQLPTADEIDAGSDVGVIPLESRTLATYEVLQIGREA